METKFIAERPAKAAQSHFLKLLAVLIAGLVLAPATAGAQVIVVQSTAKNLRAGTAIENNERVSIPAGKKAVFVLPSGATRSVDGPFDGKASDLTKGVKANPGVFEAVKRYAVTGGTSNKRVGAVRSFASPSAFPASLPFSWRAIPVNASGDFCVEKAAAVSLVRTRFAKAEMVTIVDMKSKRRVPLNFPVGAKSVSWPDTLNLSPGATYLILMKDRPQRQLRMRIITPLPAREDTLQVLHGQRCDTQFRAFIRELQKAG